MGLRSGEQGGKIIRLSSLMPIFVNHVSSCVPAILDKTTDYTLLNNACLTLLIKNHLRFLTDCPPSPPNTMLNSYDTQTNTDRWGEVLLT